MASDQQFCLRWNNHQSTLVSVFDNLLESQTLVDCTLAADGQYLKAHKVVLSACSPYLEAILCQNLDKHPILILKDVKFSELKAMLDYMYRGEVNISQEQLSTFLKAAESLQIKGLTDSGGGGSSDREREPLKRQDLRKPLNQPVPHIPQPRPVVPHPGLMERRSLPHFPPHIADMQPQSPRHAREGSTSPTARKRRRPNRPSSDDSNFVSTPNSLSENQPDTSDSCDVPVKQAASSTPNVPNATTKAPETDSNRTTPQPQNNQQNSEQKQQVSVKKEFSETLLTPKTEFDYGNDNSMEDVTYEDDEEEEVDLSKPGTSFAANSQGFPPWQMGGDGSNDDSNNMYSPDVTAATNQNNSQVIDTSCLLDVILEEQQMAWKSLTSAKKKKVVKRRTYKKTCYFPALEALKQTDRLSRTRRDIRKQLGNRTLEENTASKPAKIKCPDCDQMLYPKSLLLHQRYYCNKEPPKDLEFQVLPTQHHLALCLKCKRWHLHETIILHSKYLCKNDYVTCFYCPAVFKVSRKNPRSLMNHIRNIHSKGTYEVCDLISKLRPEDFHIDEWGVAYTSCQTPESESRFTCRVSDQERVTAKVVEGAKQNEPLGCSSIKQEQLPEISFPQEDSLHRREHDFICSVTVKNEDSSRPSILEEEIYPNLTICTKCSNPIGFKLLRLHNKYFCSNTPNRQLEWKLSESPSMEATCLKCHQNISPNLIEFHVAYVCGKRKLSVQCFYCDQFPNSYESLLSHMETVHSKRHEFLDLLSVLPPADDDLENSLKENDQSKVIKVFFSPLSNGSERSEEPVGERSLSDMPMDIYKCFYCNEIFSRVFETLEHMEEVHCLKHNTFDVIREHSS